jgi:hypothetical protein
MAGIEDMIELFRGEAPSRSGLDFGANRGRYFTPDKSFARYMAGGGQHSDLVGDLGGKVKSLKIPVSKFKELGGNTLEVLLDDASLSKAKTNLFQTFLARAGSLTPLAVRGLNMLASLPVATITAVLQSTPVNADEVNMTLEDFAKLNEGDTNIDKSLSVEAGDI